MTDNRIQALLRRAERRSGTAATQPLPPGLPAGLDPPDDLDPDDDFAGLPQPRRVSRLTVLLLGGTALALAFTGGVLVQKRHDASLTRSAALPGLGGGFPAGGLPSGFPAGGLPGAGTAGGGAAAAAPSGAGAGAGAAAGTGTGSTGDVPTLIGTVIKVDGRDVTVRDLGGTSYVVHTSDATTLTRTSTITPQQLKAGATVTVTGTKTGNQVTATAVTDTGS